MQKRRVKGIITLVVTLIIPLLGVAKTSLPPTVTEKEGVITVDPLAPIVTLEEKKDIQVNPNCDTRMLFCADPTIWFLEVKIKNTKQLAIAGTINWGRGEQDSTPFPWHEGANIIRIPYPYRLVDSGAKTITVNLKSVDEKGNEHSANQATQTVTISPKKENKNSTIRLIAPNGKERWRAGTTHTIRWSVEKTINKNQKISLLLLKSDDTSQILFENLKNNGTQQWKIPKTIAPGNYTIRLQCTLENVSCGEDVSDASFQITAPLSGLLIEAFESIFGK